MKKLLLLFASMFVLAGCGQSGSWSMSSQEKQSSEAISSSSSEEVSSEPIPEQKPDNWKMVAEADFIVAINNASAKEDPKYPTCVVNASSTAMSYEATYKRQNDGTYTTTSTNENIDIATSAVNMRLANFPYNNLGDGGKYCKPYLYVSDMGKTKVFVKDSEIIMDITFNEYGYIINFTIANENRDGPSAIFQNTWFDE